MRKFINKVLFYLNIRKTKLENYISCQKEIYLTKKFLKNKNRKKMIAVYDLLPHGVSVGDMIFFCFYLKFIQLKGKFIHFIIVHDRKERNKFFKHLPESFIKNYYLKMKTQFIMKILGEKNCKITITTWNNLNFEEINDKSNFTLFKKQTLRRQWWYGYLHYIGYFFLKDEDKSFINRYKISSKLFESNASNILRNFVKKKYISFHVRHDPVRTTSRNISDTDLISFVNKIYEKKGKTNILIISDKAGCDVSKEHYKNHKTFLDKKCKLYFCKDFTKNILEDTYLLMHSKCAFTSHAAGGMCVWLWYTNTPFLLTFWTSDLMWFKLNVLKFFKTESKTHAAMPFWNKKTQKWNNNPSHENFINLLEKYEFKY